MGSIVEGEVVVNGEDWTSYEFQPAPPTLLCLFRRNEDSIRQLQRIGQLREVNLRVWTGYAQDFSPEFNAANLEWKLTGIAREELDAMVPEFRAQVVPSAGWASMLNRLLGKGQASVSMQQASSCGLFAGHFDDLISG